MPRLKCPRGCVPESALAGYIDNHGLDLTWRHIWLSPGGDDISVVDHEDYAIRHGADGRFPNLIFERMGWIRVSLLQGTIGIEMETEPTAAQLETLDKYLSYPGMVFKTATFRNRYLQVEGFQRVTAGRIAAWVDAQGSGALGALKARRYIERHLHLDLIPSLAVWIRPGDGVDFGGIDHEKFARERMQKGFFGDAIQELELQGWIRITGYHGSISIELRVPPTNAQMRTLSDYLNSPGITVQMVSDGANTTNILRPDGATRMTAGRIAAWAAQQAPGGLGRFIDSPKVRDAGDLRRAWIAPNGNDFDAVPDHGGWAAEYFASLPHPRRYASARIALEDLLDLGWIRIFAPHGGLVVELHQPMTRQQTTTLQHYLDLPGIHFSRAALGDRQLVSDGFTKFTAGRIAAWVEAQGLGCLCP